MGPRCNQTDINFSQASVSDYGSWYDSDTHARRVASHAHSSKPTTASGSEYILQKAYNVDLLLSGALNAVDSQTDRIVSTD